MFYEDIKESYNCPIKSESKSKIIIIIEARGGGGR